MKNREKLSSLLLALGLSLGALSIPLGTAYAQAIVSTETAEGSVELSNTSGTGDQAPAAAEKKETPATETAEAPPPKDPREAYRDYVLQVPEVMPASTSAASRRYKKVDLSAYRALMQNNAAQPAQ
jgi:hypothetical protein